MEYKPKTNRCINFLQFVMENYQYWWPGPEQWTDKKGRRVVTEQEMYKAFNKAKKRE